MATTTRGYPLFTGGQAPAGPAQMAQLAEAIDADMTKTRAEVTGSANAGIAALDTRLKAVEQPPRSGLATSLPALYGPRGGGYAVPQIIREGKRRTLQGSFTNVVTINFNSSTEYPLLTLAEGDRPAGAQLHTLWTAAGGYAIVKADGVLALALTAGTYAGGAWAVDLSGVFWYVP